MSFPLSLKNECGLGCYRLKLVPFHLALTSEKPSPLSRHRLTSFFPLPQLGQYYDYTLKTVKNGLLFIEWDAIKGNPVAFSCSGGVFREVSDYGLDAGKGYVTMPLDGRVYTIRAVYIHALPEDMNAAVAAWQAIARNINAAPAAWQEITLCRKPYSGHMWDIAPLVEDFRTEGGGHLDYLATWPDSAKILHQENEADARWAGLEDADRELLEDLSEKEKNWHASVQPPAENEPAPSGACVPILLHDAIGQIYDCRRAYALSVNGIINYCRLHAPLLAGGFIVPLALELLRAQAMDRAAERVRELERGFRLGGTRPPGDAVPPPPLPAGPVRGAERLYMERLRAYEEWKASRGGRCWAWDEKKKCESDFTYNDGAAYTGLRDEFAGFDKEFAAYRNTFFRDYFALCAALKRVTEVWYTLLHSTLAHSFRGVMADCLRVEDTFARMLEGTPSPLLTLRDLTFYHAHEFLTTFPCLPVSPDNELLWRKCQDVQQSFYDDLTTRLFRKDDDPGYLDFFCSVLGTGNHPTMAAADLMTVVLPYAMHQPVNQKNPLLLAARMRIGLDCVQAKRSWLQLANDCELLGTPSDALESALESENPDIAGLATKAVNALDWFNGGLLELIAENSAETRKRITELQKEIHLLVERKRDCSTQLAALRVELGKVNSSLSILFRTLSDVPDESIMRKLKLRGPFGQFAEAEQGWVAAYRSRLEAEQKVQTTEIERQGKIETSIRLKKMDAAFSRFVAGLIVGINLFNLSAALDTLSSAPETRDTDFMRGLNSFLSVASPVLSMADALKGKLVSRAVGLAIKKTNFIFTMASTGVEMWNLFRNRNPGAAVGAGLMGVAPAFLVPSAALGGAVLAFAFLGMVALFGAGLFIYLSTRDNGVEKFLKNCLWNIHARPSNRALRELWVPCDGGVEIHPLWRKWIDRTGEHMRAFFPSRLTCRYAPDKDELVVHFEAPCGSGPECALGLTLTCLIHPIEGESPARAELTERYLIEIPRDVKGNGIYRFKARYHVVPLIMQLKKKRELPPLYRLPPPYRAKAQSSAVGEEDLSFVYAKVNVALRYRFSSDIDYGKVEEVISIPNEVPRAVIKNSLKQWGL